MAAATKEYLQNMLGDLDHVPVARLELILEASRLQVRRDGIAERHEAFADLQCFFAGFLLEKNGSLLPLVSRRVDDVALEFAQGAQATSWIDLYRIMKTNIVGLDGRIA